MKFSILLDILIELLSKRRVTASYLAEKHSLSQRTVYRYIAILAETVPAQIKRGRGGGICLSDSYKLPLGFLTAEEYDAAIEALSEAYTRSPEARFLDAKRKLSAQEKANEHSRKIAAKSVQKRGYTKSYGAERVNEKACGNTAHSRRALVLRHTYGNDRAKYKVRHRTRTRKGQGDRFRHQNKKEDNTVIK